MSSIFRDQESPIGELLQKQIDTLDEDTDFRITRLWAKLNTELMDISVRLHEVSEKVKTISEHLGIDSEDSNNNLNK